ncbi:uncharacterized protein LOC143369484 isoform X1 [Andrena cerasifolii]|uniref:uncharacterized protein LOC143369484 isoform X1 n=1 Tax=Andrena cerasifolii TaxID=2819439 RepID=UPI0040381518
MEDKTSSGNATTGENQSANAIPSKKTSKSKVAKAQRPKSSHPPTSEMVNSAIRDLKDRKGSSLQAIKKYIASTYKVDGEKLAPFIKRYLKTAVTSGAVVQTKGKGASGSFKLSGAPAKGPETKTKSRRELRKTDSASTTEKKPAEKKQVVSPKKAAVSKKQATAKKAAMAETKKPASPKKARTTAASKKTETAAKQKVVAQTKSLSKATKATKTPAAKTKTPKPKTAKSPKAAKASAKK